MLDVGQFGSGRRMDFELVLGGLPGHCGVRCIPPRLHGPTLVESIERIFDVQRFRLQVLEERGVDTDWFREAVRSSGH